MRPRRDWRSRRPRRDEHRTREQPPTPATAKARALSTSWRNLAAIARYVRAEQVDFGIASATGLLQRFEQSSFGAGTVAAPEQRERVGELGERPAGAVGEFKGAKAPRDGRSPASPSSAPSEARGAQGFGDIRRALPECLAPRGQVRGGRQPSASLRSVPAYRAHATTRTRRRSARATTGPSIAGLQASEV